METRSTKLLRIAEVQARTGISRSQLYELVKQGQFPQSVELIGRTRAWVEYEVLQWIHERITAGKKGKARISIQSEHVVPEAGLEPASLAAGVFETPASTDFATRATRNRNRSEAASDPDHFQKLTFRVLKPTVGIDKNWHVTDSDDSCVAHCFGFFHDIDQGEGLARRIAACLNYCASIPTSELLARFEVRS